MRLDNRLSRMLHVLLHMDNMDRPVTSEKIAEMLRTNPGVVRRTMASLRIAGFVVAERGHGGGWTLAKKLSEISLLQIYVALGEPRLFAIGSSDNENKCPLEKAANAALNRALAVATAAFTAQFEKETLADLIDTAANYQQA